MVVLPKSGDDTVCPEGALLVDLSEPTPLIAVARVFDPDYVGQRR
jgi:hypothetical protein